MGGADGIMFVCLGIRTAIPHSLEALFAQWKMLWPLGMVAIGFVGRGVAHLRQRRRERRAHQWPAVAAVVEVASVIDRIVSENNSTSVPVATLTYFYRRPDLQMGEYERFFSERKDAERWVNQYRHRTVTVHVNPANAADSVLLSEDLDGLDLRQTGNESREPNVASEAHEGLHEALSPGHRALCGVAEVLSMAGLSVSAAFLALSLFRRGAVQPAVFYWIGGVLLGLVVVAIVLIHIELWRSEGGQLLLRTYRRWCPGWMRWSFKITSALTASLLAVHQFLGDFFKFALRAWFPWLQPYAPYLVGCWLFFLSMGFLAAILRSQEELRVPAMTA